MESKNQLVIFMVPIHSGRPWASCNIYAPMHSRCPWPSCKFWVLLYRRHFT